MTGQHLEDMQISYVKTRDEKRESIGEITVSRTVLEDVLTKREALLVAGPVNFGMFPAAHDQFVRCFLARFQRPFGAEDSEALSLR
ncbi:MAG TPA: hypothetical protein DIT01_20445 [Lentisphaeria bacterium]|nr:hypothetical protein [Lentisphaeria bacterium]